MRRDAHGSALSGRHVLVTAGPTREPLDPARFLSNASTGKAGFAIAAACVEAGARVTLVHGPVSLTPPLGVDTVGVTTALEMEAAVAPHLATADAIIMAAASACGWPAAARNPAPFTVLQMISERWQSRAKSMCMTFTRPFCIC